MQSVVLYRKRQRLSIPDGVRGPRETLRGVTRAEEINTTEMKSCTRVNDSNRFLLGNVYRQTDAKIPRPTHVFSAPHYTAIELPNSYLRT